MPQIPFAQPGLPATPNAPDVKVEDLGQSVLKGHQVEGKRFLIQPPALPKPPGLSMPATPKRGRVPAMPQVPAAPQPPTTAEVWTSTTMRVPMLTKMSGGFGKLTQVCQSAVPGEPHPKEFQIPQDYRVIGAGK